MDGFLIFGALRWMLMTQATFCVNSVAHTFGERRYKNIPPCESFFTTLVTGGEGWHNWHHTYPYDYAAAELGPLFQHNSTKLFIDVLALVGQVSDRRRKKARKEAEQ